jgi:hypothetical protein
MGLAGDKKELIHRTHFDTGDGGRVYLRNVSYALHVHAV